MAKPIISFNATDENIRHAIEAYAKADGQKNLSHIEACLTLQGVVKSNKPADNFFALYFAHVDKLKGYPTPDTEQGRFKGAVRMAEMSYCGTFMDHMLDLLPAVTYLGRLAAWCRKDFKDPSNGPTLDQMRAKLKALQAESNKAKSTKGESEAKAEGEAKADDKVTPDKRLARVIAAVTDYVAKAGDPAGHVAIALQHLQAEASRLTAIVAAPVEVSEYETGKPVDAPAAPVEAVVSAALQAVAKGIRTPRNRAKNKGK